MVPTQGVVWPYRPRPLVAALKLMVEVLANRPAEGHRAFAAVTCYPVRAQDDEATASQTASHTCHARLPMGTWPRPSSPGEPGAAFIAAWNKKFDVPSQMTETRIVFTCADVRP